jgi:hypothetical protein
VKDGSATIMRWGCPVHDGLIVDPDELSANLLNLGVQGGHAECSNDGDDGVGPSCRADTRSIANSVLIATRRGTITSVEIPGQLRQQPAG